MNPRRADQLTRAAKLRANVSVALGVGDEAPTVVELAAVKWSQLRINHRLCVQVLSWIDNRAPIEHVVSSYDSERFFLNEEMLADAVDTALDAFEARGKRQAATPPT